MSFDSLENMKRFFKLISTSNGQEFLKNENYDAITFPNSIWPNFILNLKVKPENLDSWLSELQVKIRDDKHPKTLLCNALDIEPELLTKLKTGPTTNLYWASMTYNLNKPIQIKVIENFEIKRVTSKADIKDWCYIAEQSLLKQNKIDQTIFQNLAKSEVIENYIGYKSGKPVAISMLFKDEEWAGIYFVGTLPEHERKGYGTSLTQYAMQKGLERGCKEAILQATQAGEPVYHKIGFDYRGRIELFILQLD